MEQTLWPDRVHERVKPPILKARRLDEDGQ